MERNQGSITKTMFSYWLIVILWQTFRPVANRSIVDMLVKLGCMTILVIYAMKRRHGNNDSGFALVFAFFIVTQFVTLFFESSGIALSTFITIAFMIIQIVIFLIWLNYEPASIENLEQFTRNLTLIAVVMGLYNVIFNTGRFLSMLSSFGGAYGSECTSFLYSNHEFGIYLAAGMISFIWLYYRGKVGGFRFLIVEFFLGANLLSTASRTAIIALVASVYILLFFYDKKKFFIWLVGGAIVLGIVLSVPKLYNTFFLKILKGSFTEGQVFDAGRSSMYENSWEYFKEANFLQKLFGRGQGNASGHDAYLYILNCGGICMFICFLAVIFMGIKFSFSIIRFDKSVGGLMIGYQVFALLYMVAQTPILFYSTMDSFFITMTAILLPKYVYNYYVYYLPQCPEDY